MNTAEIIRQAILDSAAGYLDLLRDCEEQIPYVQVRTQTGADGTLTVQIPGPMGGEVSRTIRTGNMAAALEDICTAGNSLHPEARRTLEGAAQAVFNGAYCTLKAAPAA